MLTVSNIKWKYKPFFLTRDLLNALNATFKSANIKVNMTYTDAPSTIVFNPIEKGKIAISAKENKIVLRPDDPRIKRLGRDHLLSKRLTQNQYILFYYVIQNQLDILGLEADITLEVSGKQYVLRNGTIKNVNYPMPKSFPVSM